MDLELSWENGNRTGFPPGPHSVELAALQRDRTPDFQTCPHHPRRTKGNTDEAVAEACYAVRANPQVPDAPLHLGLLLARAGQTEQALGAFRQANRLGGGQYSRTGGARSGPLPWRRLRGSLGRGRAQPVLGQSVPADPLRDRPRGCRRPAGEALKVVLAEPAGSARH